MIRTFLFDMGNVLVHFSHERMCAQMAALCGTDAESMRAFLFDEGIQADFERGRLSEAELHQHLDRRFPGGFTVEEVIKAGSDIFHLNEPIVPILDGLKSSGYRLVLLSNTSISHLRWVREQWDVLDRFDHLVTSCETGAIKPEPPIFEAALKAANCAASECFYTDDIATYVTTARGYGIDAEVFTETAALVSQLRQRGVELEGVSGVRPHGA